MKYFDMVEEVDRRLGEDDFTSRATDAVQRAWDYLSRNLRISSMLTTVAVTPDADGSFDLPEGFVEGFFMALDRRDPPVDPVALTPESVGEIIPYQPDVFTLGSYRGYSVVDDRVITTLDDAPLLMRYYAKFPVPSSLVPSTPLMVKEPDLCVSATIAQGAVIFNNTAVLEIMVPYLAGLLENVQQNDDRLRYSGVRIQKQLGPRLPLRFFLQ